MIYVPSSGPPRARLMVVGEAPGAREESEGKPFVGPAGEELRNFMQQVGIDPADVYFTNLCKFRPPENKLHNFFLDGGVPNELVRTGLAELINEIREINPHVIYAAGNFPLHFLTGKGRWVDEERDGKRIRGFFGIHDWRGSILHSTLVPGFKVIPSFHPSYVLQEGKEDHPDLLADLARIKRESEFPEIRRPTKHVYLASEIPQYLVNYWDVVDSNAAPVWEHGDVSRLDIEDRLLSDEAPVTLDIEYIVSKLLCCGLTTHRDYAYVFPTSSLSELSYLSALVNRIKRFNMQNSMFDSSIMEWHYGLKIMPKVVFDTMVCAYCAAIERPKGLDYLVSIYTDQPFYKSMVSWPLIKKGLQPLSVVYAYNGIDVWTQHEIMEEQIKWELPDDSTRKTFDFLMLLLEPLWEMSKRGIRMDLELLKNIDGILEGEAAQRKLDLLLLTGASTILNVRSPDQVADLLYNKLGLPVIKRGKKGPSCDDKTLAELSRKTADEDIKKTIMLIRQERTALNLKSKFFDLEFDSDARMRGHYDPTKTVTGRLASRKFYPTNRGTNQQNIPTDKRARRVFIADRGKVFGYADLEKAESLIVAHLTMDPLMLRDHSPGQNAHKNLGVALFNKPASEIDEDEYFLAKRTRHAGNYMQGALTFMRNVNQVAAKTGVSIEFAEAERFINIYRSIHVGLTKWWREVEAELWRSRTLYNLLGFRRRFGGHIRSILPEAVAFVPQSTVGQVLNLGLLNLSGRCAPYIEERGIWSEYEDIASQLEDCGFELLQQIHDAVGFQCWERDIDRVVPLLRRALSIPLRNPHTREDFRIPVEVLVDLDPEHIRLHKSNWGDSKVYKKDLELAHV